MLLAEVGLCSLTTACMLLASVIIGPCWWQPTGAGLGLAFVALRNRRWDGFAAFLMAVFAVGTALSFATGDVRFMLAKDSIGTTVTGLIFLSTCIIGRPMSLYAAQRFLRPPVEAKRGGTTCGKLAPHSAAVSG